MAIETLYATSHITGTWGTPANAVGFTTGTWAGVLNTNSNYTSRWAMGDPVDPLTAGATDQTITIWAKKGSNSGTPTIQINIYENGTLVQSGSTQNVTSTTGQALTQTFPSSIITNRANVEVELVEIGAGGSGSVRNSAQVDYIRWDANTTAAVPKHVSGGSGGSISVTGLGGGSKSASGGSGGVVEVTGAGGGFSTGGEPAAPPELYLVSLFALGGNLIIGSEFTAENGGLHLIARKSRDGGVTVP